MTSAFYLPLGLEEGLETTIQRFGPPHDALELHLPVVGPDDLLRWIESLRAAREEHLARRPIAKTIQSLDRASRRFLDPGDSARREAVESLARAGRFTAPMLERALDDAFQPVTRGGLTKWIQSEIGAVQALDRPAPGPSGMTRRAHGPEWMLQIYAGNIPTLPVWPIYSALILKSALLAKTSAQEPLLAPLLAKTIAEVDETLGACLAVVWWKGGTSDLDRTALSLAPAVLAFGGEEAMASVGRQSPRDAVRVLHGPKVSIGYVERRALSYAALRSLAARAALDVSMFDQQGCLSPHALYVERRGEVSPAKFAEALAAALESHAHLLPRGVMATKDAASVQLFRAQARFEAAGSAAGSVAGAAGTQVLESPDATAWTVALEAGAGFEPGPTHRTVRVHVIDGFDELARGLRGTTSFIEAVGLEARGPERTRLAAAFSALGIPRVAPIGELQRPSPLGTHGGVRRLLPFVTWTTVEESRGRAPKSQDSKPSGRGSRRPGSTRRR